MKDKRVADRKISNGVKPLFFLAPLEIPEWTRKTKVFGYSYGYKRFLTGLAGILFLWVWPAYGEVIKPIMEEIAIVVDEEAPRKALFLIAEGFHDLETFIPKSRLREENFQITIGGIEVGKYKAGYGSRYTLEVEIAARDIKIEEYDVVVIPGGKSPAILRESEEVLALVREAHRQGKIIAAICHGPQVLVSAGILPGKRVTAFSRVKNEILEAGAEYIDREVVRDSNIITSRLPIDLPAFCRALISALQEEEIKPHPPEE